MSSEALRVEATGGILRITLNRPDKLNAFTREMMGALDEALRAAETDAAVRVVVITGAGRAFAAGQDLSEGVYVKGGPQPDLGLLLDFYNPIIARIRALPKPVVAAVNGMAAGAGANLALACDIVVAARSAKFLQAFAKIGLIPDCGGTWLLPRLVGDARARGLTMLADPIGAEQAEAWGMIWKAVDDDTLKAEVDVIAGRLAEAATYGLALTKKALLAAETNGFEDQLALERSLQSAAGQSPDYAEGVGAFLERRPAKFTGAKR
jgi:2-(1,2-epoxy-1,2-dihydrophenyl)acetyl-CoA isomerase